MSNVIKCRQSPQEGALTLPLAVQQYLIRVYYVLGDHIRRLLGACSVHQTLNLYGWCVLADSDHLGSLGHLNYNCWRLFEIRVVILLIELSGQNCIHLLIPHVCLLVLPLRRLLGTVHGLEIGQRNLAHHPSSLG